MNCPQCGTLIPIGTSKCINCGAAVRTSDDSAANSDIKSWAVAKFQEYKLLIIAFAVLCAVTLPCAFCIGYRAQWILWKLGL